MEFFLRQPSYLFGCFGFYTVPLWRRRILLTGVVLSGISFAAAITGKLLGSSEGKLEESIFGIAVAWIIVFCLMRIFCTGTMWILSHIFDSISDAVPSLDSTMHFLERVYWMMLEIFLSASFIGILVWSILVQFGIGSLNEPTHPPYG